MLELITQAIQLAEAVFSMALFGAFVVSMALAVVYSVAR